MFAYFGHHKCATTWMVNILTEMMADLGMNTYLGQTSILKVDELKKLNEYDFVISANSSYKNALNTNFIKAFHVIRDPRDVIVSGYFSHLYSHSTEGWPELEQHRKILQKLNQEEGLLAEMEFSAQFLNHMGNWNYDNPDILEFKMEELVETPLDGMVTCMKFFGLFNPGEPVLTSFFLKGKLNRIINKVGGNPFFNRNGVPMNYLQYITEKNSFKKLSKGRAKGEENKRSHYRKGAKNDWMNYFSDKHCDHFERMFPNLTSKLGYEDGAL